MTETLPLLDQQIEANEKLLANGYVSKLKVIEMRRQRLVAARDRDAALADRLGHAHLVTTGNDRRPPVQVSNVLGSPITLGAALLPVHAFSAEA